jgi:flagellar biogenesis protein FliO
MQNNEPLEARASSQTIPSDTVKLRKHSKRDDFFLTLKLVGIVILILGAIWGIEYLQSRQRASRSGQCILS